MTLLVSGKHPDQTTIESTLPCTSARSFRSYTLTLFRSLERAVCFRLLGSLKGSLRFHCLNDASIVVGHWLKTITLTIVLCLEQEPKECSFAMICLYCQHS